MLCWCYIEKIGYLSNAMGKMWKKDERRVGWGCLRGESYVDPWLMRRFIPRDRRSIYHSSHHIPDKTSPSRMIRRVFHGTSHHPRHPRASLHNLNTLGVFLFRPGVDFLFFCSVPKRYQSSVSIFQLYNQTHLKS